MSWVPLAIILGALGLYALSRSGQPRCPNCKAFVVENARRCRKCGAPIGWD